MTDTKKPMAEMTIEELTAWEEELREAGRRLEEVEIESYLAERKAKREGGQKNQ